MIELTKDHVGYYNAPGAPPVCDPGEAAPCLYCGKPWVPDTVRTFNVMPVDDGSPAVSIFYRVHRACDDAATEEQRTELGSRVIHMFAPCAGSGQGGK